MFLFHLIRMVKNQTFKINPDPIIMNNLLKIFGLSGLTDSRFFTKENTKECFLGKYFPGEFLSQNKIQRNYFYCLF